MVLNSQSCEAILLAADILLVASRNVESRDDYDRLNDASCLLCDIITDFKIEEPNELRG